MGRKNEGILNLLTELPWWVSVIFSPIVYMGLKWILPAIYIENSFFKGFTQALPNMAWFIAIVFLVPAPILAFNSWRKKRLLDIQTGIHSIRSLSWKEFEKIVSEIFQRKGYSVIENSDMGPNDGVDVVLKKNGNIFLAKFKQLRAKKIGVSIIREMYGVMLEKGANGIIIITSGFFTKQAKSFAIGKSIKLIEGNQLASIVVGMQEVKDKPFKTDINQISTSICQHYGN
jgi:restriction system protein